MTKKEFYQKYDIDPERLNYAGKGDFGIAYYTGDLRILKITKAKSEFELAKNLVGNTEYWTNALVKIYAAEEVEGEKWILMEELNLDSEIEQYFYEVQSILDQEGLPIQYIHYIDWDDKEVPEDVVYFANQIDSINLAYRHLGVEASDIRPENLGYDKNGKLKAFDIHDRSIGEVRKTIRKIIAERFNFNNNHSYSPPENVKTAARQALASGAKTSNGGNEGSGTRKAEELANGTMQSHSQMKRLKAFFDANQPGSPEWELHGGNAAKMWVEKALSGTHDANMRTKENMRRAGGGGHGMNDGMGTMSATMMKTNNSRNHSVWTRTKNRMQEAVKPNRSREILFTDEYGKNIVYDDGSHRIAVDDPKDAAYVTLWREKKGKWIKVGAIDAWKSEMNYKDRNGKYLNIAQANIDKNSKGKGYGSKMYQALIDFSAQNIAGIYSYLPNRVNKKEIPKIYKKFDSEIDGDYDIIDFQNEAFIDQDGQLKDFSFNDDDAEDEVVDEKVGEQFQLEFNMWLYDLNGAKVYGFTLDIDEIGSRWIGDNDDYEIYVHVFPPPDYENIILIHLYKEDNLHYSKSYPIDKDFIYDNGPDRVWEAYIKSLKSFIQECHKTGKFLDL